MNGETTDPDTNSAEAGEETVVDPPSSNRSNEGEIVSDTWVNPNVPGYTIRRTTVRREIDYTLPEGRSSIVRSIFGSVVILTDELGKWSSMSNEDDLPRQTVEAALHRAAEQQEGMEDRPFATLRYGAIGLLSGTLDAAEQGTGRFSTLTNRIARTTGKVIRPVWNSFFFRPFHEPMKRVEKAGEEKVNEWVTRGRIEEVHSRALAEVGINNFVEGSVTEITENAQVQMIVQQVIASQSTGLLSEILVQFRQRFVNLDLLFMDKLRRAQVAAPDFRDAYLQTMTERRPQYHHADLNLSLAGTYAGPIGRLTAFLIDLVVLILTAGLFSSFVSSTLALFGLTDMVVSFLLSGGLVSTIALVFILLFNFLLIAVYFFASWYLIGSTPGDLIFGIRVVNKEGQHASFWRSFLRLIGTIISAIFLFLGFVWALFDRRRQGWHDKIAGTFVLYDWPAKLGEDFQSPTGQ